MDSAALSNVRLEHADVRAFDEPFHVGLALHACGEVRHSRRAASDVAHEAGVVLSSCGLCPRATQATDLAHQRCVRARAAYVLASCCVGKVAHSATVTYPRSAAFQALLGGCRDHYLALAAAADVFSSHMRSDAERARRLCKSYVEVREARPPTHGAAVGAVV